VSEPIADKTETADRPSSTFPDNVSAPLVKPPGPVSPIKQQPSFDDVADGSSYQSNEEQEVASDTVSSVTALDVKPASTSPAEDPSTSVQTLRRRSINALKRQHSITSEQLAPVKRRLSSEKIRSVAEGQTTQRSTSDTSVNAHIDDLFTDQLDDLIGNIDDITDSVKCDSETVLNDEALLQEMQELLS